ncbi:hypothetical protein [Bradyrhizobium sp.]|uniref:hypothetical protein n=1 Tax=Bradyrhizobium sp. TaxID=376 RepID=UPI0027323189|nr:hypothetical protein [Bradyrhizobium sp.]MDP3076630.1 hypothetical protein [Bradyrhizobium sp.]
MAHIIPCIAARSVASGTPSEPVPEFCRRARTRRDAAWQKSTAARGLHRLEIRFAPEMIASSDHAAHLFHTELEADMTASLIALALAGLVAVVAWEVFQ